MEDAEVLAAAGVALDEVVTIEEDMIGVDTVLLVEVDTVEALGAGPGVMRRIRLRRRRWQPHLVAVYWYCNN